MSNSTKRLLIVDDSPDVLNSMKIGLEFKKFKTGAYTSPIEALAEFEAGKYDLALLDIQMPEMNGFELCRQLLKKDPKLKVCFFTAFESYRDQFGREFPEIESDCFLRKPMSINQLTVEINKFLARE